MKSTNFLFVTVLSPLLCCTAFSQEIPVKPGLWEHHMDITSESGRIEAALELARTQMALLPPAQRKMVEDTIRQQGLKVDFANQVFQNCITEEEARTGMFSFAQDGGCQQTNIKNEGATTHIDFICAQGQGELTLENGVEYTGTSSMTLNFAGVVENATATHSGRWLGASCAAIK